jgi:anaerobic dimethyl sulfoxide reductase subunit B (iron-sulfur subunit)
VLFRWVQDFETGIFPTPGYYHHSYTCNHCESPACVAVCPSGALYIAENKTVQNDYDICIGCKNCLKACPYEVPQYLDEKEIAIKCNMCIDFTEKGENPICVEACPQFALEWGDLDELMARHPGAVKDLPILPDSAQTNPSTIISPRSCAFETGFRQKPI